MQPYELLFPAIFLTAVGALVLFSPETVARLYARGWAGTSEVNLGRGHRVAYRIIGGLLLAGAVTLLGAMIWG